MAGELVTAALGNVHWRDNLAYLKAAPLFDTSISVTASTNVVTGGAGFLQIGHSTLSNPAFLRLRGDGATLGAYVSYYDNSGDHNWNAGIADDLGLHFYKGTSGSSTTDYFSLTSAGVVTFAGFGAHLFTSTGTGANSLGVTHTSAGTSNQAQVKITSNTVTAIIGTTSSTFTAASNIPQAGTYIQTDGAGGLTLAANQGTIKMYTGLGSYTLAVTVSATTQTIAVAGHGSHTFGSGAGGAGGNNVISKNLTDGTGGIASFSAQTDATGGVVVLRACATSYTGGGVDGAGSGTVESSVGGLHLAASHATGGVIKFFSGGTTERARFDLNGAFYIGDTINATVTQGVTINQGGFDDAILELKSSDVAHGVTGVTETDSYGKFDKHSATAGGLQIRGLSEDVKSLYLIGTSTNDDATKSTSGVAPISLQANKKSGTGEGGGAANSNLCTFVVGGVGTRFILDVDGDSHQDVGTAWTTFDSHDDLAVLTSLALEVSRPDDPWKDRIRQQFGESLDALLPREAMQAMKLVTFNEDGHHFVNMSKLTMLLVGAVRQSAARIQQLEGLLLPPAPHGSAA